MSENNLKEKIKDMSEDQQEIILKLADILDNEDEAIIDYVKNEL